MKKAELTRREFIKTAGKGLSLLALFSGVIRFDAPARAQGNEELFVNDLIRGEDQLKITFLEVRDPEKSDAFFIMYLSEKGLDIILHDGGMDDHKTYEALLDLRSEILESADHELIIPMNPRCESLNAGIAAAICMWQMKQ